MSSPAKRMLPASGSSMPASWLMKVVLPAPLGPMTACVSPSRTSKSMPSHARRAPKFFDSARTSSMEASRVGFREDAGKAAAEEDHRQHEQRSEDDLPVLRPARQQVLDQQQRERAQHRAGRGGHAAEDDHEHDVP